MEQIDPDAAIGPRIRRLRRVRGKSQEVVAGLAGISQSHLSKIESGERALDKRSLTKKIAKALDVAPSELGALPFPMSSPDGHLDLAVDAVRTAMHEAVIGITDGEVQPVDYLRARVDAVLSTKQRCLHAEVGRILPDLIRDIHASIAAGRDVAELLRLAVELHHAGTQGFLHAAGAASDLCWQAARMSANAAEELDDPVALGVAAFGQANGLLAWGSFKLSKQVLGTVSASVDDVQLSGMLALTSSLIATAESRSADATAALEYASDLASRTGEGNAHYLSFGPTNVMAWRLSNALEADDISTAAELADSIDASRIMAPSRRANYFVNRGRALAPIPSRRGDAVRALRSAERISADKIGRNPFALSTLDELLMHAKRDAVGEELRGLAYRAGLEV